MARIRGIKPDFFFDEHIAELSLSQRLAFIGLWCYADKDGRLEDSPKSLKAKIFPYDDADMEKILSRLATGKKPFILRYVVEGRAYIQIINFAKHQRPHHTEKPGDFPLPPCLNGEKPLDNGYVTVKEPCLNRKKKVEKEMEKEKEKEKEMEKENGGGRPLQLLASQDKDPKDKDTLKMTAQDRIIWLFKMSLGIPESDIDWDLTYRASNLQAAEAIIAAFYGDKVFAVEYTRKKVEQLKAWASDGPGRHYPISMVAENANADRGKYTEWKAQQDKISHGESPGSRGGGFERAGDFIGDFLGKMGVK